MAKKTASGKKPKLKSCVRAAKYQIVDLGDGYKEIFKRWFAVADELTVAANTFYQRWLLYHVQAGTADAIRQMRVEWRAYKENGGPKPEKIDPFPKACYEAYYRPTVESAPGVHSAVVGQLIQAERSRFLSRKATQGAWSYWQQVLLCRERLPQFTHPLPIPLKREHYQLIPPPVGSSTGEYRIETRLDRLEPKPGNKRGTSHAESFALFTRKRNMANYRAILGRIARGEYERRGGAIRWDGKARKWMFSLMYQLPSVTEGGEGVATLRPCESHPWELELENRTMRIGGDGREVSVVRRQIVGQRRSRQANYRNAGSSNKGHGTKRALAPLYKLSNRWKDFVKTHNNQATARVVQIALEHGVGTVVYEQPEGSLRGDCFLATAGEDDPRFQSWDWFQVRSQLENKCQEHGIQVIVRKTGGVEETEDAAAMDVAAQAV